MKSFVSLINIHAPNAIGPPTCWNSSCKFDGTGR